MIKGFESYTYELSAHEKQIALKIAKWLKTNANGKKNMRQSIEIEERFLLVGTRVRKMINYLRSTGKVKFILSNGRGYWCSKKEEEVQSCITSMKQRARSISKVARDMETQLLG